MLVFILQGKEVSFPFNKPLLQIPRSIDFKYPYFFLSVTSKQTQISFSIAGQLSGNVFVYCAIDPIFLQEMFVAIQISRLQLQFLLQVQQTVLCIKFTSLYTLQFAFISLNIWSYKYELCIQTNNAILSKYFLKLVTLYQQMPYRICTCIFLAVR